MFHATEIQILTSTIGALGLLASLAVYLNASTAMRKYVSKY